LYIKFFKNHFDSFLYRALQYILHIYICTHYYSLNIIDIDYADLKSTESFFLFFPLLLFLRRKVFMCFLRRFFPIFCLPLFFLLVATRRKTVLLVDQRRKEKREGRSACSTFNNNITYLWAERIFIQQHTRLDQRHQVHLASNLHDRLFMRLNLLE